MLSFIFSYFMQVWQISSSIFIYRRKMQQSPSMCSSTPFLSDTDIFEICNFLSSLGDLLDSISERLDAMRSLFQIFPSHIISRCNKRKWIEMDGSSSCNYNRRASIMRNLFSFKEQIICGCSRGKSVRELFKASESNTGLLKVRDCVSGVRR